MMVSAYQTITFGMLLMEWPRGCINFLAQERCRIKPHAFTAHEHEMCGSIPHLSCDTKNLIFCAVYAWMWQKFIFLQLSVTIFTMHH